MTTSEERISSQETGMSDHRKKYVAMAKAAFAALVWGGSFAATKLALQEASPALLAWIRFGIANLVLGSVVIARHELKIPAKRDLTLFTLLGCLGITLHQWLQANGLLSSQAITTAWIVTSIPAFAACFGWWLLREKMFGPQILGFMIATVGVLLVISRGNLIALVNGKPGAPGDWLILLSAITWALFSTCSRRLLTRHTPANMLFWTMLIGWVFTFPWVLQGQGFSPMSTLSLKCWTSILFLAIIPSGFGYIAWYDALHVLPVGQASAFLYLEPLSAMIMGYIFFNERVTIPILLGGTLIITGVWLTSHRMTFKILRPIKTLLP